MAFQILSGAKFHSAAEQKSEFTWRRSTRRSVVHWPKPLRPQMLRFPHRVSLARRLPDPPAQEIIHWRCWKISPVVCLIFLGPALRREPWTILHPRVILCASRLFRIRRGLCIVSRARRCFVTSRLQAVFRRLPPSNCRLRRETFASAIDTGDVSLPVLHRQH